MEAVSQPFLKFGDRVGRGEKPKQQEEWKGSLILNSFSALHTWYPLADVLRPVAINQAANNE